MATLRTAQHEVTDFLYMQSLDFKPSSPDRRAFSEIRNLIMELPQSAFEPFTFDATREVNSR